MSGTNGRVTKVVAVVVREAATLVVAVHRLDDPGVHHRPKNLHQRSPLPLNRNPNQLPLSPNRPPLRPKRRPQSPKAKITKMWQILMF
ncbi:uncharacterized protein LOC135139532 isoform X2 [Zophobas morio]|uniref:uncharacterized protein LOC135139532 isoform X2 n=1 Tax=Zophobas morio TaxID=2755281 RepID=UPI0030830129